MPNKRLELTSGRGRAWSPLAAQAGCSTDHRAVLGREENDAE
jgi:hypothetical protein